MARSDLVVHRSHLSVLWNRICSINLKKNTPRDGARL
jgi:hypothetical protein